MVFVEKKNNNNGAVSLRLMEDKKNKKIGEKK
jgi:hypothetical protein